ncbi:MAG TPA: HAMP domain-containing sensor histidine kinase [Bacteroidales bacterium]|nr:HAMP domain-containing sensor histidine kinase [Bacteroidales bacterium]
MKKRRVLIFAWIAVFALLGIVATQAFWVKDALALRQDQFKQRVKIAMKSVSTQILDAQINSSAKYLMTPCDTDFFNTKPVEEIVDIKVLDSLLRFEFICMSIDDDYNYGVFNGGDSAFILGPFEDCQQELLSSEHRVSLTCIYKEDVYFLSVYFPDEGRIILHEMILLIILSLIFLVILILSFYMILRLMFRQKRLSEVKTDFINNMTHEFKTPIATISLSSEMLLKPEVNEYPYKTKRYATVIFDENARLQKQVEQVLQLSVLDRGEFKLKPKDLDIHRIIRRLAEHYSIIAIRKGGTINTELNAENYILQADKTHISNIVANLIDNAIKYTPESPDIRISTYNKAKSFFMSISDNGIGISAENQKDIFRKLYRVPTGNLHDVKGFGLGLFYVKTMVEAHGGSISVHSEPGKGTSMIIELPLQKQP